METKMYEMHTERKMKERKKRKGKMNDMAPMLNSVCFGNYFDVSRCGIVNEMNVQKMHARKHISCVKLCR